MCHYYSVFNSFLISDIFDWSLKKWLKHHFIQIYKATIEENVSEMATGIMLGSDGSINEVCTRNNYVKNLKTTFLKQLFVSIILT